MIIYKTTNTINGKFYIGKDKYNNPDYFGSGKRLNDAIKCYGKENFKKEVLEYCKTYEQMSEREIFWISELNSIHPNGYNLATGGDGGDTISNHPNRDSIAKNHSQWMKENNPTKGKKKTQKEIDNWRKSYGDKWQGENNPNYGRKHTKETKQLQSEIRKEWNINLSKKERENISKKISDANTGKDGYWKDKTRENHSQWMKENNPMKGQTHTDEVKEFLSNLHKGKSKSEEHRRKLSENQKHAKSCMINGVEYRSIGYASKQLNIPEGTVRGRLKNKNFEDWYYVEETR